MEHPFRSPLASVLAAAVLVVTVLVWPPACTTTRVSHRQTDVMEKSGTVSVSAAELRAQVNVLANRFADQIEQTADRIRDATPDRAVRRRALVFKLDAVPAVYTAAYRADPLAAVVDTWALAFQVDLYLREGPGREAFGSAQGLAREGAAELVSEADLLARHVTRPGEFDGARAKVLGWAQRNPVRHTFSSRPSGASFAAGLLRPDERDAFVALGEVTDTVESVSERLNVYAAQLPKLARWQAELLLAESAGERGVAGALGDVQALGQAARRAEALMDEAPELVGAESPAAALLAAERRALLAGVNAQRLQTLEYASSERLAILAAVHEERVATLAALRQERIEALKEIDAIKGRGVDAAVVGLKEVVDHTLWRLAALLLLLMVAAGGMGAVALRLALGRARPRAS